MEKFRMFKKTTFFASLIAFTLSASVAFAQDYRHGYPWTMPPVVTPGAAPGAPPSDAIILFDGTDTSAWDRNWEVEDGAMFPNINLPRSDSRRGDIRTRQRFGSVQLHLEFMIPPHVTNRTGQARGNSGVFFGDNRYEVQILDSFESETYPDGQAASIYKQMPPLVNASRRPGEWQTLDIIYLRPELKIENNVVFVIRPAYITVFHNGVLVVHNYQLEGSTFFNRPPVYEAHEPLTPILLQDHGSNGGVRFRNIWVREIPDRPNLRPEPNRMPFYIRGGEELLINR